MLKNLLVIILLLCGFQSSGQCDAAKHPIVFIHGFLASGDTYAKQIQRFVDRGYCQNRLFVFDWNSISANGKKTDSLLNAFIDGVLKSTGASQIDLVGHSAGGGLGRGYLVDSINAAKVAHYVNIGSRKWYADYSWFPNKKCLNIYSTADKIMGKWGGDIEGAANIDLKDKDHYEVATSYDTWSAMYLFFQDEDITESMPPAMVAIPDVYAISGKAVQLGSNEPIQNATVAIYKLNSANGTRLSKEPFNIFRTDATGHWGTLQTDDKTYYEFELTNANESQRPVSYFFEPFTQSDSYVYLRGFPQGGMVSAMLGAIPVDEQQSVIAIYSAFKAMIAGRDSVTVNGIPVSSATLTPASKTVISSFIFDDGDGKTSGNMLKQYSLAPFLGGVDIYLPVNKNKGHTIYYNGRKLALPAISAKERILLAVFN